MSCSAADALDGLPEPPTLRQVWWSNWKRPWYLPFEAHRPRVAAGLTVGDLGPGAAEVRLAAGGAVVGAAAAVLADHLALGLALGLADRLLLDRAGLLGGALLGLPDGGRSHAVELEGLTDQDQVRVAQTVQLGQLVPVGAVGLGDLGEGVTRLDLVVGGERATGACGRDTGTEAGDGQGPDYPAGTSPGTGMSGFGHQSSAPHELSWAW